MKRDSVVDKAMKVIKENKYSTIEKIFYKPGVIGFKTKKVDANNKIFNTMKKAFPEREVFVTAGNPAPSNNFVERLVQ